MLDALLRHAEGMIGFSKWKPTKSESRRDETIKLFTTIVASFLDYAQLYCRIVHWYLLTVL